MDLMHKYSQPIEVIVRAALAVGDITLHRRYQRQPEWRFGRRKFAHATIMKFVDAGEAVRTGDTVRAA